jgi:hypothetical protein
MNYNIFYTINTIASFSKLLHTPKKQSFEYFHYYVVAYFFKPFTHFLVNILLKLIESVYVIID